MVFRTQGHVSGLYMLLQRAPHVLDIHLSS